MSTAAVVDPDERLNVFADPSVLSLSPRQRNLVLPLVLRFLEEHESAVGQRLMGRLADKWSKKDAQKLERLVGQKAPTQKTVEDYLSVLRKACQYWAAKKRMMVVYPRIPIVILEPVNPFSFNFVKALARFKAYQEVLAASIEAAEKAKTVPTIGDLILSAILYGGLHSANQVAALFRALQVLPERLIWLGGRPHVELYVSWHGVPEVELRRWQPDPLSATLLLRVYSSGVDVEFESLAHPLTERELIARLAKRIREKFTAIGSSDKRTLLSGLKPLIQAAQIVAWKELPVLVAEYAAREFVSHSLPRATLTRIFARERVPDVTHEAPMVLPPLQQTSASCGMKEEKERYRPRKRADDATGEVEQVRALLAGDDVLVTRQKLGEFVPPTPFITRMVDFGDHLLGTPSPSGKPRTVAAVRAIVARTTEYLGPRMKGQNPVDRTTAELEEIYVRILAESGASNIGGPAEHRLRYKLANCINAFHEYLRVCFGKEPVEDRATLFCGETFSDVQAEFLTLEEYQTLLADIDTKLLDLLTPYGRRVARILVTLGYRCGLRRTEALNCTIQELLLDNDGNLVEIILIPSEGHTFKSLSAPRRISADVIPTDERNEFQAWIRERLEQEPNPTDFIFGNRDENITAPSPRIVDAINVIMPGESSFHGLRHSCGTTIITRLLASERPIAGDFFPHRPTSNWIKSGEDLRQTLYGHNRHTRKHAFKLAQFLGHLSPSTSFTYTHLFDFTLRAYLDQTPSLCADPQLVRRASGVSRSTRDGWEKTGGVMSIPFNMLRKLGGAPVKDKINKSEAGTPKAAPTSVALISEAHNLLYSAGTWKRELSEVAAIRGVPLEVATRWFEFAKYLEQLKSKPRDGGGGWRHHMENWRLNSKEIDDTVRLSCPLRPDQPHDQEIVSKLAPAIEGLASSDMEWEREMLSKALTTYVHHVWYSRPLVIFHGLEDRAEAANYIGVLRKIGIYLKHIAWYSFDESVRGEFCVLWREALKLEEYQIQILPQPYQNNESARSWFGVMPQFSFEEPETGASKYTNIENPGAYGFRYLMLMEFIRWGSL